MHKEAISKAVERRLGEVRERVAQLDPERFHDRNGLARLASFVTSIEQLLAEDFVSFKEKRLPAAQHWITAADDCVGSLLSLALGNEIRMAEATPPQDGTVLEQLRAVAAKRQSVFELLADRYACALNFSFQTEEPIREYVLMRLMTADRARAESMNSTIDHDDLLLKINLIAVHACVSTDLRFLDALNYYYELLPATLYPESEHPSLLVSWLALYARALNSWLYISR